MEGERERARAMQRLEVATTTSPLVWRPGTLVVRILFLVCAHNTEEAVSASSKMALVADKAISGESWTASAKEKERYWWSIDLRGEVQELEVGGPWTSTNGNSMDAEERCTTSQTAKRLQLKKRNLWED